MKTAEIKDWNEINSILNELQNISSKSLLYKFIYRGVCNTDWQLFTSIARIISGNLQSEKKAMFYEKQSMMEFSAIYHLSDEKTVYNDQMEVMAQLTDMQHFSCPTRLLDWSSSPYVALYFAMSENLDADGALFIWDYAMYSSSVKRNNPRFTDMNLTELIRFNEFNHVQITLPTKKNERIYRQQGLFSVSNNILKAHCEIIDSLHEKYSDENSLLKLVISKNIKLEFLDRLKYMNITASTLFPGLDGIGREIRESLLIRKWKNM